MEIRHITKNQFWYSFQTEHLIPRRQADKAIDCICNYVDYLKDHEHADFIHKYSEYIITECGNARKQNVGRLKEAMRKRKTSIVSTPEITHITPFHPGTDKDRKNLRNAFDTSTPIVSQPSAMKINNLNNTSS